jgi:hypothetical protein
LFWLVFEWLIIGEWSWVYLSAPCFFKKINISFMNWLIENYTDVIAILVGLIGVAEIIVNLTPSEKDNSILLKIKNGLAAIFPNFKVGGGTH